MQHGVRAATKRTSQRVVLDGVLSAARCARLAWLLRALAHTGYRPHVESLNTWEVARCDPRLLPQLVAARQVVLHAVEQAFGREAELYIEWSGLVAWGAGSGIDWHADNARDYLRQRVISAVLYLNDQGADFQGGSLLFKEGEPRAVAPRAGRLAAYGSGEADAHGVEPVERGVRHTLTVWLTDDPAYSEDRKAGGSSREGWP